MTLLKRSALVVLLLAAMLGPGHAAERILLFVSDVQVERDGELRVTETIRVQAEGQEIRRGILRDFPTLYHRADGTRVEVGFTVESVTRDGAPESFATERLANGMRVRIGSADVWLSSGVYQYVITYRTTRQIGYLASFDELYWNATGTGWTFPIDVAEARITLPETVRFRQTSLYTGPQGARGKDATVVEQQPGRIVFRTTQPLPARSGLTVAAAWDKGLVAKPGAARQAQWWVRDNLPLAVGGLGFLLLGGYYVYGWWRVGRDRRDGTIIPRFEAPKGLSAAAVRYIWRMGYDNRVFAVAILDLAVRGHLKLVDRDDTMQVELGKNDAAVGAAEQALKKKLFASDNALLLSDANHGVLGAANNALKLLLAKTYADRLFHSNARWAHRGLVAWFGLIVAVATALFLAYDKNAMAGVLVGSLFVAPAVMGMAHMVRAMWRGQATLRGDGVGLLLVALFAGGMTAVLSFIARDAVELSGFAAIVLAAPMVSLSYSWLKAPTAAGGKILDEIEGLRLYLGVAEEERLAFLHPPEKTPELFERLLPYAVALDVENAWATRFADVLAAAAVGASAASWYDGKREVFRDPAALASRLGSGLTDTVASASTPPGSSSSDSDSGSSGGGSSGGGGGGGGGSGW